MRLVGNTDFKLIKSGPSGIGLVGKLSYHTVRRTPGAIPERYGNQFNITTGVEITNLFIDCMYSIGFPFFVKKLFTRNIVTYVTNGYYVGMTVVTT